MKFEVAEDKAIHSLVCFIIVIVFNLIVGLFWASIIALVIGVIKELLDIKTTGFDKKDLLADVIGIIVAVICIIMGSN